MASPYVEAVGWIGNVAYFSRFLVQWIASERAKRIVTPQVFWWLSLFGAIMLVSYSIAIGDPIMLAGYSITTSIYARNVWIARHGTRASRLGALPAALLGLAVAVVLTWIETSKAGEGGPAVARAWQLFGGVGMAIWTSRFLLQWWYAERHGDTGLRESFWWLSLVGNVMLLAYTVQLGNVVYIAGFVPGPIVQVRNLIIARRSARVPGDPLRP